MTGIRKYFWFFINILVMSCARNIDKPVSLFTLLPSDSTGVFFRNDLTETEDMNIIEYLYFNNGGGVAAGDINNDGLIDLYFCANQKSAKLYLNKGDFHFEDITEKSGISGQGNWKTGVTMADVNGDGFLDIYQCHVSDYKGLRGRNQLFINHGDLTFTEEAASYGLDFQGFSTQALFFDYDLDGDLDMYLLNHSVHTTRSYGSASLRNETDPKAGDRLYRNDFTGDSIHFTDVTREAGIYSSQIGYGLNVSAADLNNDNYPDLYVSNDFHENDYLYFNNGDGTFSERLTEMISYTSRSSMGNDIGDINNDGLEDIIVLDMLPYREEIEKRSGGEDEYDIYEIKRSYGYYPQFVRNTLQLNLGNNLFSEIGRLAGIYSTDWSWCPLWCDLDNDGWIDLYITNGIFRRPNDLDYIRFLTDDRSGMRPVNTTSLPDKTLYEKMALDSLVNFAFKNNRDLTFTNYAGKWGMDKKSYSNGAVYADLDNDGDLDLAVNNINDEAFIYRNNGRQLADQHYIQFRMHGKGKNKFGIGVRIFLFTGDKIQTGENFTTRGFYSSVAPGLHFGTGNLSRVDSATVIWPGGKSQKFINLTTDTLIDIDERDANIPFEGLHFTKISHPQFRKTDDHQGLNFMHEENKFQDYTIEKLMPHNLSSAGPAIAVGDVNSDGLEDIYIGGARDQESVLFVQRQGEFIKSRQKSFSLDRYFEDVDARFLDADLDGDLDLYVVSGGNDYVLPHPLMKDRLYLNDGKGNFSSGYGKLPEFYHNGSCVVVLDFDSDGDPDIFTGSRSVPRAYGLPPLSFLMVNNGLGRFNMAGDTVAGPVMQAGMITDATTLDADLDGDPDLALAGEWMPVTLFINDNGIFVRDTNDMALENRSGWWFSLQSADIDNDGDPDLVAGNLGLNTYLKTRNHNPVKMYLNDFDRNGRLDQIITINKNGKEYPFASLDELASQMPALKIKYKSYRSFAGQTVSDIFPVELINTSLIMEANTFESGLFINDGKGNFSWASLPVEVQFAPVRGIFVQDFNNDGISDLLLGGNFLEVKPSFGMYGSTYGWYLRGIGNGEFDVLSPQKSGFLVHGEITGLYTIQVNSKQIILVGRNNDSVEEFEINPE